MSHVALGHRWVASFLRIQTFLQDETHRLAKCYYFWSVYTLGRVEKQALNSQNRGYQWKLTETVISAPISLNWEEWTSDLLSTRHGILPHWHRWTILWSESCHLWLKTHKQREQTPLGSTILAVIHVEGVLIDVVTTPVLTYEPKYFFCVQEQKWLLCNLVLAGSVPMFFG